jgi:glutamate racemase
MLKNAPIAYIDSGVGGLPYLQWVKDKLPLENFLYIADTKNFPYGEKDQDEIVDIVTHLVKRLNEKGKPKLLVIACNTASVTALDAVRKVVKIPVVGVVPAVKPAAEISKNKKIGVLATQRTVNGSYLKGLIKDFASSCQVEKIAGSGIVRFVENDFFTSDKSEQDKIISKAVEQFREKNVDTVVLGCTHFIFITDLLKSRLGEDIRIVDSRDGVGKQIIKLLRGANMLSELKTEDRFYCTSTVSEESYRKFADMFGLAYCGVIGEK